jgi:hypothetical protein
VIFGGMDLIGGLSQKFVYAAGQFGSILLSVRLKSGLIRGAAFGGRAL